MNNRGFTLIELLVVTAIIGVLATVIMTALNGAKSRANDSRIKAQLTEMRAAMELYYDTHQNYGAATNLCDNIFDDPSVIAYVDNMPGGVTPKCVSTGTGYAVTANFLGAVGTYWCVDYRGYSISKAQIQADGDDTCN